MKDQDIYSWIETEENDYETQEKQVGENWFWNMRNHVQMIFHLMNGVFFTGANDWMRSFKNIMEPILELCGWTEDLEVKDVTFFIEGEDDRALSFLVKKYHEEVYTKEHDLDRMFDEITDTDLAYGGVLVQKGVDRPEVIDFQKIAFCDQTDILGGPIAFKYYFSPSKLKEMGKYGWGDEKNGATISLQDLCELATQSKDTDGVTSENRNSTPGKNIEVYVVRGNMPETYLSDDGDEDYHVNQLQIVAFYSNRDGKQGVTLYRKKEDEGNIKFFTFKKIPGRALGRGVGEKLIHPQIWTNWLEIHKHSLLEAASKVPLVTDDSSYSNKNKIQDMENLEITTIEEGKSISQIQTAAPANIQLFEKSVDGWYQHAQFTGQAYDSLMGIEESSGTTFKGQERLVAQGRGPHDRRRGQRAKFIEEIYMSPGWILDDIIKEITKGKKFLATLSTDELMWVADQMAVGAVNKRVKEMILNSSKIVTPAEQEFMMQTFKQDFLKKGNKQLLEVIKNEFKDKKVKIQINVAGKQKNLAGLSDKILSVFQFALANPVPPHLAKPFNDILEYGGLSPADFASFQAQMQTQSANPAIPSPIKQPLTPAQNG